MWQIGHPPMDGFPAVLSFLTGVRYTAIGKAAKAAKQLVKAELSMNRAESLAVQAAHTIVDDLISNGLLATPKATQDGVQRIHLIGHSRGAAVNARVATILDGLGYKVDQYTALDGYSVDWPHGSGILGDINIVAELFGVNTPIKTPGRLHHKSRSRENLFEVAFVPRGVEAFVFDSDLESGFVFQ